MTELTPEQAEKARKLMEVFAKPAAQPMSFQIDLKSVFTVLVGVALCTTANYNNAETKQKAFALADLFFKPDGTLND